MISIQLPHILLTVSDGVATLRPSHGELSEYGTYLEVRPAVTIPLELLDMLAGQEADPTRIEAECADAHRRMLLELSRCLFNDMGGVRIKYSSPQEYGQEQDSLTPILARLMEGR